MSIYITEQTRLVIQGATGYTSRELIPELEKFGTEVVSGIAPTGGPEEVAGVPVYTSMARANVETDPNTSFVLVPAPYVKDACLEAIDAGIETIITIAEGVPIQDTLVVVEYAKRHGVTLVGPNTLGVISPGKGAALLSYYTNNHWYQPGNVGLVARSGSLSAEIADLLSQQDIGQSTVLSVGGDPYLGTAPGTVLREFDRDDETEVIAYIGEVGSRFERDVADTIPALETPVVATVIGRHAPTGKKMGHAGAIAQTDSDKTSMLREAGAEVVQTPFELPGAIAQYL